MSTASQGSLRENSVGLLGDFVFSVACSGPSSSVAFTLAILVGFAGHVSPLAVLVVGTAMFLVSMGYASLNRWKAHAGAPYVWVSDATSPAVGVGTGFLSVAVSTLANVGNITLAGAYLLFVVSPSTTFSKPVTWIVATLIMGGLLFLSIRGIKPSIRFQWLLVIVEYTSMVTFVILALIHESHHIGGATLPSLSDFSIGHAVGGIGGFAGLAKAAVPCGFLYVGWDATAVLAEESTNQHINPGRAVMMGTLFLTFWYTFLIMVFQGVSSQSNVLSHGSDVLAYSGQLLVPGFWGRALPLAVLVAVIGTSQAMMTQPSRILFAMARDKIIPAVFGRLGKKYQTPVIALVVLAVIPPLSLIPYLVGGSANHAIGDAIGADGMLALFMYFVIAVASVWFYRSQLTGHLGRALKIGVLPLVGGIFMFVIFAYGLKTQTPIVAKVAVALIVLVFVLGFVVKAVAGSTPFFTQRDTRDRSAIEH